MLVGAHEERRRPRDGPARLKGIETVQAHPSAPGLEVPRDGPARLKGIETGVAAAVVHDAVAVARDGPARLKGIETVLDGRLVEPRRHRPRWACPLKGH